MSTTKDEAIGEYPQPTVGAGTPRAQVSATAGHIAVAALPRSWATLVATVIAIVAAWLLSGAPLGVVLVAIALLAAALSVFPGRAEPSSLVLGLIPATLVANSGLVPAITYFVAPATLGLAIVLWTAVWAFQHRRLPPIPSRTLAVLALVYVLAAGVATLSSIRPALSVSYLAALTVIVPGALWLGPWLLTRSGDRTSLLALLALVGVFVTLAGLVLSMTGPVLWFDRWLGAYLANELTINGVPTGIILLRIAGPFLAPGGAALVLVPAILAALALRRQLYGPRHTLACLAVIVMTVGLLATFTRVGWMAVIVGATVLVLGAARDRRFDVLSTLVAGSMALAFVGLWVNAFGTDYRPDITEERNQAAIDVPVDGGSDGGAIVPEIPTPETPDGGPVDGEPPRFASRGGSEMSGRLEIWAASIRAIGDSPLVGYGPGTNAIALEPYLVGESRRFVGLTSHSTWLRTWVETGVLGVVALIGIALVPLFLTVRRALSHRRVTWLQVGLLSMFLSLVGAQMFETLLLGGVGLPSFVWALVAGLLVLDEGRDLTQEAEA